MIEGRNIVCVASSWFDHPTSKQHVMRLLAQRNEVLWINFHASRTPRFTAADARAALRRLGQIFRGGVQVERQIQACSPFVLPFPKSAVARNLNLRSLRRTIAAFLRRRPESAAQLWLFTPDVPELIGAAAWERVVYYCVDHFAGFEGYDPALIGELEGRTLREAHTVLASSPPLWESCRRQNTNTHHVPHGVDYAHFAATPELPASAIPEELRGLPRPVIGYFGLIADYVDLDLIAGAAVARPDWSFVLIGDRTCDVSVLRGLANVHLLGPRPYAALPQYCRGFDVGIIPFRRGALTKAVNPIKLREYLAAGLPVVSAPMPALAPYAAGVHTADTLPEFLAGCAAALARSAETGPRPYQSLVQGESWEARVERIGEIVAGQVEAQAAISAG